MIGALKQLRSDAFSNYNALQLYLTRRQGSLRYTVGYTLSSAMTNVSGNADNPEDPFNRGFNYGPASFDRRHVLVSTYTYELPWLQTRRDLVELVAGGWEVSGITRWQYLTSRATRPSVCGAPTSAVTSLRPTGRRTAVQHRGGLRTRRTTGAAPRRWARSEGRTSSAPMYRCGSAGRCRAACGWACRRTSSTWSIG